MRSDSLGQRVLDTNRLNGMTTVEGSYSYSSGFPNQYFTDTSKLMDSYQNTNASNSRLLDVGNALRTIELCLQEKIRIQVNSSMPEDIKVEKLEAIDEILKSNMILWQ